MMKRRKRFEEALKVVSREFPEARNIPLVEDRKYIIPNMVYTRRGVEIRFSPRSSILLKLAGGEYPVFLHELGHAVQVKRALEAGRDPEEVVGKYPHIAEAFADYIKSKFSRRRNLHYYSHYVSYGLFPLSMTLLHLISHDPVSAALAIASASRYLSLPYWRRLRKIFSEYPHPEKPEEIEKRLGKLRYLARLDKYFFKALFTLGSPVNMRKLLKRIRRSQQQ